MRGKYLIDTNIFITPYKSYYAFDLAPTFWESVLPELSDNIGLLDVVKDEILKGNDELSKWIKEISNLNIYSIKTPEVLSCYSEVLDYIRQCGFYNDSALRKWSDISVADPWLLAAAKAYDSIIVTFESSAGRLSLKNPTSNCKIPDIANQFNIKCIDLFSLMRNLKIVL